MTPGGWPVSLVTAVIAAAVALVTTILAQPLRFLADRALYRGQIRTQYRQERLKAIKEVIGEHLGPLLEAAETFDHRMRNMYRGQENRSWLAVDGRYRNGSHYIDTTVQRFLYVIRTVRKFEVRALHVDPRVVEPSDFRFVTYCKLLRWAMTDVSLFDGLPGDHYHARDHFFADVLRAIADEAIAAEQDAFPAFRAGLPDRSPCWQVWRFFDGLDPDEPRLRWDRLVAFHLVILLFLRMYGYPMQRPIAADFADPLKQLRHPETLANLRTCLRRYGLGRSELRLLRPR